MAWMATEHTGSKLYAYEPARCRGREAESGDTRPASVEQGVQARFCEVSLGGAIFVAMALTPYGEWHGEKDPAESWTRMTTHTGDEMWGKLTSLLRVRPTV